MATRHSQALEKEVCIQARPETIFPFFTDPKKIIQWKGIEATLEPYRGGIYRVNINGRDIVSGRYVEISPYKRIVFTWGWEGDGNPVPPDSSTVEITLVPDGASTIVRLRHNGLPEAAREIHGQGWDHYMARLALAAAGKDPGPDPMVSQPMHP